MKIANISVADIFDVMDVLPADERGLFLQILHKMYSRGGGLPDVDKDNARMFGYERPSTYRKILDRLLARKHLNLYVEDGLIMDARVIKTVKKVEQKSFENGKKVEQKSFENGKKVEQKSFENGKKVEQKSFESPIQQQTNSTAYEVSRARVKPKPKPKPKDSKKETPKSPCRGPTPMDCLTAFEEYNQMALECGLPQAAKLTPDRERKIRARLKDYGLDGWRQALGNIRKSAFLTGSNDRSWRANLEFLLQATSFGKVHDGGYGNGAGREKLQRGEATLRYLEERERMVNG